MFVLRRGRLHHSHALYARPDPRSSIMHYLPYFAERGWHQDLHMLNGKLFPSWA